MAYYKSNNGLLSIQTFPLVVVVLKFWFTEDDEDDDETPVKSTWR